MNERTAVISYSVPDAWEVWSIDILDDNAPSQITAEWLQANPGGWEYFDIKDRGGDQMVDLVVEDYDEIEDDDDDVVYTLTPKGKLVTDLLREGLDYETASRIAGAAFPDNGEVVGS